MALKGIDLKIKTGVNYAEHLITSPIVGSSSTQKITKGVAQASQITETETIHPGVFNEGMSIRVEGGRTLNLGNFESAKIGVGITIPCSKDTLNEAYEYATEWVSEKIEEAVKEAKS